MFKLFSSNKIFKIYYVIKYLKFNAIINRVFAKDDTLTSEVSVLMGETKFWKSYSVTCNNVFVILYELK